MKVKTTYMNVKKTARIRMSLRMAMVSNKPYYLISHGIYIAHIIVMESKIAFLLKQYKFNTLLHMDFRI